MFLDPGFRRYYDVGFDCGERMIPALEWFATIGGIIAAFMISLDFGRRVTGWGFVLFAFASVAWIGYGLMDAAGGILTGSEERRVGNEGVSKGRCRWGPEH